MPLQILLLEQVRLQIAHLGQMLSLMLLLPIVFSMNFNKNDIEDNLEMNNNNNNEEKSSSTTSKKRVKSSKKKESVEMTNESLLEQLRKIRQEDD